MNTNPVERLNERLTSLMGVDAAPRVDGGDELVSPNPSAAVDENPNLVDRDEKPTPGDMAATPAVNDLAAIAAQLLAYRAEPSEAGQRRTLGAFARMEREARLGRPAWSPRALAGLVARWTGVSGSDPAGSPVSGSKAAETRISSPKDSERSGRSPIFLGFPRLGGFKGLVVMLVLLLLLMASPVVSEAAPRGPLGVLRRVAEVAAQLVQTEIVSPIADLVDRFADGLAAQVGADGGANGSVSQAEPPAGGDEDQGPDLTGGDVIARGGAGPFDGDGASPDDGGRLSLGPSVAEPTAVSRVAGGNVPIFNAAAIPWSTPTAVRSPAVATAVPSVGAAPLVPTAPATAAPVERPRERSTVGAPSQPPAPAPTQTPTQVPAPTQAPSALPPGGPGGPGGGPGIPGLPTSTLLPPGSPVPAPSLTPIRPGPTNPPAPTSRPSPTSAPSPTVDPAVCPGLIRGTVRRADGGSLQDLRVYLVAEQPEADPQPAVAQADGSYVADKVCGGDYGVVAFMVDSARRLWVGEYDRDGDGNPDIVHVSAADPTHSGIDITVNTQTEVAGPNCPGPTGTISGQVLDASGTGVAGAWILVERGGMKYRVGVSEADGSYRTASVCQRNYLVSAFVPSNPPLLGYFDEDGDGSPDWVTLSASRPNASGVDISVKEP